MLTSRTFIGTLIGGFFTGLAVCGMHYMCQIGLANYSASYNLGYVFGSALIAIFTSTIALGVFFYFSATPTDNWLKRVLCASLIAVSVSGMHWVATVGCEYRLESEAAYTMAELSRQATSILVICLVCSPLYRSICDADPLYTVRWLLPYSRRSGTDREEVP